MGDSLTDIELAMVLLYSGSLYSPVLCVNFEYLATSTHCYWRRFIMPGAFYLN